MRAKRRTATVLLVLVAAGFETNAAPPPAGTSDGPAFYVASHGWHTSIVLARGQIPARVWPPGILDKTFAGFRYLEIGWGDREFYIAPHPSVAMAFDAALLPGPSVLHVVGLRATPASALPGSELVRVPCSRDDFVHLCGALADSFERDESGHVRAIANGLYGETSRFYPARGRYYLLNTCDTWTARMARAGGLVVRTDVGATWSAGAVITQVKRAVAARALRAQ